MTVRLFGQIVVVIRGMRWHSMARSGQGPVLRDWLSIGGVIPCGAKWQSGLSFRCASLVRMEAGRRSGTEQADADVHSLFECEVQQ